MTKTILLGITVVAVLALSMAVILTLMPVQETEAKPTSATGVISESTILSGLAAGALFPYIDTTPNQIGGAHLAITDATAACDGVITNTPTNIVILAGVAGGVLSPVTLANTSIGSAAQCVFHADIVPGAGGLPGTITDIVVVNGGGGALTGSNTITVSARVIP